MIAIIIILLIFSEHRTIITQQDQCTLTIMRYPLTPILRFLLFCKCGIAEFEYDSSDSSIMGIPDNARN